MFGRFNGLPLLKRNHPDKLAKLRIEESVGERQTTAALSFLAGGGEMGARIRSFDWNSTALGSPETWPQSLKTAIRIMLMSRQPVWIGWGEDLTYFYNDPYLSIIGGKHPWALAQPTRIVWQEIYPVIGPMLLTAMSGDEGTYAESQLLVMERNGYPEETYYTFSYSPIPDDEGNPGGIFCANTDDTQRVIGQRELALLRDLVAQSAKSESAAEACERCVHALGEGRRDLPFVGIYLVDPSDGSARLCECTGISEGHLLMPKQLLPGNGPYDFRRVLADRLPQIQDIPVDSEEVPTGAWPIPPKQIITLPLAAAGDGSGGGVLVVGASPYRLVDGAYLRFLGLVANQVATAISDAEAVRRERARIEAMAELDRAKTAFFTNISHEFRTPLTLMLGPVQDLLSDHSPSLSPRTRLELETVHRNGLRLQKLVNSLLDYTRLEAGRRQAEFRPTDLGRFTAELVSGFRSTVERAGLRLNVDCPSLPPTIFVDRALWENVILNLVSNAFKHTFEGEISVVSSLRDDFVEVTVRDTGVGIPPGEVPHLFERFRRIEGARARTIEGSGIGLALVDEIVRVHGGEISVESCTDVADHGTAFTIRLPRGPAHLPPDQVVDTDFSVAHATEEVGRWLPDEPLDLVPTAPLEAPSLPVRVRGARVLIADDNADMRAYLDRLLSASFRVETVEDGRAALESIRTSPPDVLVTDVMMPELDGFKLVAEIRADPKTASLPVVMLSARAGEDSRVEGLDSGADDYLVKPFGARELIARVDSAVTLSKMRSDTADRLREMAESLEETVRLRTLDLEHANQELQGFTYSVAHDLRQQIRGINANASIALQDAGDRLEPQTQENLRRLVRAARRLGELVDDLLHYAKLGQAPIRASEVDLTVMANDVFAALQRSGQCENDVEFVSRPTPPAVGDPILLRIVIENLLDNACKYSRKSKHPRIEFGADDAGYFVKDNGIGFDPAYAHKLFQPFERLHNDDSYAGTGIGLANVHRILARHGGSISAEGRPGLGATFHFTVGRSTTGANGTLDAQGAETVGSVT